MSFCTKPAPRARTVAIERRQQREDIEEINRRLNELMAFPRSKLGSITNTSIESGKTNPATGIRGDWRGTVFQPIYEACGLNEERAGMFSGSVWKMVIIGRPERELRFLFNRFDF